MSVHEDLLNNGENNCSFTEDEVDIMCSKDGDDARRDGSTAFPQKARRTYQRKS
jgi:site-specific DNA recombinase